MSKLKSVAITCASQLTRSTTMQRRELGAWAERAGHTVVKFYEDQGISGAKGRDERPAFDALLKAAVRREINMITVWSSDRLGRSLQHLVEVLRSSETPALACIFTLSPSTPPRRLAEICSACSVCSANSSGR